MSLLLDALKKAADDKKQKSLDNAPDDAPAPAPAPAGIDADIEDDVLDLDLEPELEEPVTSQDDFPEVDDSAIKQAADVELESEQGDEVVETTNVEISEQSLANSEDISTSSDKDIYLPEDNQTAINKTASDEPEEDHDSEEAAPAQPPVIEKAEAISFTSKSDARPDKDANRIESEKALSALINKSNQHSRKEQMRNRISIAILVILILLGSGVYFYIELSSSSQDIYLAANNSAPVNRQAAMNETPPLSTTNPVTKQNQASTSKPIDTATNNTVPVKKAVTPKPAIKAKPESRLDESKIISIVHTKKQDPIHVLLNDAYRAFQSGDFARSENLYTQVISREENNRDALLGLSAIAVKQQRYEYARQKYQTLLRLNPRDSLATAGLSSIKDHIDPQHSESQLKFMLKQQPDAPHLYFALGNLYAEQLRWPEAQSAYFSAWSAANKNADYALNLAISLDHLNKPEQALSFYQLSLKLQKASSGNFSTESIQQRIQVLQGAIR